VKIDLHKTGMDATRLDRIGEHLDRFIEAGKLPNYDVSVQRRGRPAYRRMAGLANVQTGQPNAEDTNFRNYSMTNPVT
jgi:CubicO group peptidase (beta-lactamase class C family)